MAKEVKDLTSKEVDEVKILKTSLLECPVNTDLGCNESKATNWVKLDNKTTDVKLELLNKLQDGLANGAGIEYLMQLSCIYNNIR